MRAPGDAAYRAIAGLLCLIAFAMSSCERASKIEAREAAALKIALELAAPPDVIGKAGGGPALWDQTRKFYELRQNKPAWISAGKPLPAVQALTAVLATAADEGLNPAEYGAEQIPSEVAGLKGAKDATAATNLELSLTSTLLRYGSHLALGHPIAKEIDQNWTVPPRVVDIAGIVQTAVAGNDLEALPEKLAPPHPEYARVRQMLQRYRQIAAEGKYQAIPTDLKATAGEASPQLAVLRNDLLLLGDLKEQARGDDNVFDENLSKAETAFDQRNATQTATTPDAKKIAAIDTYDENLGAAVRRFEARHGLDPDGVPDPAMIAALNVTPQDRATTLALNLERWRWMPADFGTPHIFVNVASYSMQVRDTDESIPVRMRVIAGKPENRTPIFSDVMTEIVFSPYWNIPESIEIKEMWPAIAKNRDYLAKKQIEVVRTVNGKTHVVNPSTIDWAHAKDAVDFQLRQKSGAQNSLGFVKFIFPNRHNVYLHDTPAGNLFDKLTRDLSHGCVRLEQPVELAAYLLRDQPEWTAQRIEAAMHAGTEDHVALKNPIPVHLVYLTARVDEDGVPQFFNDVYGYDAKQQELMAASAAKPLNTAANFIGG